MHTIHITPESLRELADDLENRDHVRTLATDDGTLIDFINPDA